MTQIIKTKQIYFTVTNDLIYDQRMNRICTSLAENGYSVTLIGRKLKTSPALSVKKYNQKRLFCFFEKGKLFYLEYNFRLFVYLLFRRMDLVCAIDLDTILPVYAISKFKNIVRVYDAHELFTELKEVVTRPHIKYFWQFIEKITVPNFKNGYTVCDSIAGEFKRKYKVSYQTIRNVPILNSSINQISQEKYILYQGAVNEGRGLEYLIPAMKFLNCKLVIAGDGNFMEELKILILSNKVEDKVELLGMITPDELNAKTSHAFIGISLVENLGLNQYWSLTNKFFDYINSAIPQITMNYPEYKKIKEQFEIALLIDDLSPKTIADSINKLFDDNAYYLMLKENCFKARKILNWEIEEKLLLNFYRTVLNN